MRTLFISEDLWELVDKGYVEEEIPRDAMRDVRKNDAKALFFIQQAISESIFPQISKAMKSKEAWDSLQTKYQSTSLDAAQDGDGSQTDIPLMDDSVYEAAAKGDIEALKKIPESEFHAQLSPKHNTILHIASEFGKIECVNWILDFPSSSSLLRCPNLNEDTPLHLAAREGHLKVVEALINAARKPTLDIETGPGPHKVMLRMKNKGKDTALHEAVRYGNREVVKLLIKEDPDLVYGANDSGITPLYMAAEGRFRAIVEIIIDESKETGTSPPYIGGLFLIGIRSNEMPHVFWVGFKVSADDSGSPMLDLLNNWLSANVGSADSEIPIAIAIWLVVLLMKKRFSTISAKF
eukprot:XP_010650366.1 PREDICTED: ankyrin-1-like [Vitis vinifera]